MREFLRKVLGAPPSPENASPEQVEQYNRQYLETNSRRYSEAPDSGDGDPTMSLPTAKELGGDPEYKSEFPWLFSQEAQGVRWDFDPIELRVLAQDNAWVGMLVSSIVKEIAETSWTITEADSQRETQKRLSTHPEERERIEKDLPDTFAEDIHDLLRDPNPDDDWHDLVQMIMADALEVGSMAVVKAFDQRYYDEEGDLVADADELIPLALKPTAPEVWTKEYTDKTGIRSGFWEFDRNSTPGSTNQRTRGVGTPIHFENGELMWADLNQRTNRRYGIPPTLRVKDFLQSLDLAVTQEQEYLSRGSIPSGAWVFENWDKNRMEEWKEENAENVKGKPHKSLMFAGEGGDVRFEAMSMNFQDLEFTERMRWYARVIASSFQVPTAVVGLEPEQVNYATFQGERENFESNTLGPYLQKIERVINNQLIRPHWGDGYRFEFVPGMSESTRSMIADRVTSTFNANLTTRNEARRELGREPLDDAEDGFKDEVVEGGDENPLEDLAMSLDSGSITKEFSAELLAIRPPEGDDMFADDVDTIGIGVDFPNDAVYVDWHNDVFPDPLDDSHVSIYSSVEDLETATGNVVESLGTVDAENRELAQTAKSVVETASEGDTDFRKADDDAMRNTDDWAMFDVQPGEVDALADDLGEEINALWQSILNDDDIAQAIERLATPGDDTDVSKSLNDVTRQIRDLLSSSDIVADIESQIEAATADEMEESIRAAIGAEGQSVEVGPMIDNLQARDMSFADEFVDRMADEVRETIAEGAEAGKNSIGIRQDLEAKGDEFSGWQGERIARQELQIASGQARSEYAAETGRVEVWQTSEDGRVRDAHSQMNGLWKYPGDEWIVDYPDRGTETEDVPGDSEPGIGCRCQVLIREREDVDADDYGGDNAP